MKDEAAKLAIEAEGGAGVKRLMANKNEPSRKRASVEDCRPCSIQDIIVGDFVRIRDPKFDDKKGKAQVVSITLEKKRTVEVRKLGLKYDNGDVIVAPSTKSYYKYFPSTVEV